MAGPFSLAEIASRLGGRVAGNPDVLISQVASLERANSAQIAFLSNPRYRAKLAATRAGAVILGADAEALTEIPRLVAENPYAAFARVSQLLNPAEPVLPGIDPTASIAEGASIDPACRIGPGAVVGEGAAVGPRTSVGAGCHVGKGTRIGADCILYPSVVLYHGCVLGDRVTLHSGVVIGADGFGIARDAGRWLKIPQIGGVRIGSDVEIGANTTIDRGAMDDTVIGDGVKLDNQIQIGHNCHVGAHTAMAGCVAVAGSARIGAHCTIGAASLILGHLSIADHVEISAATVISRSISEPGTYTGMYPFDDNASWLRNTAHVRHLDELAQRIKALEKKLGGRKDG
jgi:UDP-3-O-[3-hydroxymyristoyl] glucosamine N-acyltransferase